MTNKRILYTGKYLFALAFAYVPAENLLGNKTLVLISIPVSEIGPNLVSKYRKSSAEYVFCCMRFIVSLVASRS